MHLLSAIFFPHLVGPNLIKWKKYEKVLALHRFLINLHNPTFTFHTAYYIRVHVSWSEVWLEHLNSVKKFSTRIQVTTEAPILSKSKGVSFYMYIVPTSITNPIFPVVHVHVSECKLS